MTAKAWKNLSLEEKNKHQTQSEIMRKKYQESIQRNDNSSSRRNKKRASTSTREDIRRTKVT